MHTLDLILFYTMYSLSGHWVWLDALIIVAGTYLLYIIQCADCHPSILCALCIHGTSTYLSHAT